MERSKFVAANEDLVEIQNVLSNTDVIEACTKERANTKWKYYKLTNFDVFAVPLIEDLMGCKDAVLPEPFPKNTVSCIAYQENTGKHYQDSFCVFRALASHLHGNGALEETSESSTLFLRNLYELIQQFSMCL